MSPTSSTYRPRLIEDRLATYLRELPAVMVTGPRAVGKTTTARQLAATTIRLDQPAQAVSFRADPDAALRGLEEPVLLDEWQEVPEVLGAVRRAVEADGHANRFILTGSVRGDLGGKVWPGTGRLVRVRMFGLTIREQERQLVAETFLTRLSYATLSAFARPPKTLDLRDYVEMSLRGAFPEPIVKAFSDPVRRGWLASYIEQLLTHDVPGLVRDHAHLRRFFEVIALSTAGTPTDRTMSEAAGIDYRTAERYLSLLSDVFMVDSTAAFTSNRLKRLIKLPKRYIVDPALIAGVTGLDTAAILKDGDLLGRVLDTFVMAQLRPELELEATPTRLYHLRDANGRREIDIIGERGAGVVAVEVKATAAPRVDDARHLIYLRDEIGPSFLAGAVLHTGPGMFELSHGIFALPISSIWA